MNKYDTRDSVATIELERDERTEELKKRLAKALIQERGYVSLTPDNQEKVNSVLKSLASMRFVTRADLEYIAKNLLSGVAPQLVQYIPIALDQAANELKETLGVLVIYTGGTIGSAPKDPNDPDSPQIVKPWKDLKESINQMGLLGYPVDAISFSEPLDSCNVGPQHWKTMVEIIVKNYHKYNGFVILHGTDSMAYSASALSFMLLDLAKPVVFTGSQVAGIVNPRNDAHQNIITALMLANPEANRLPVIPEVIVYFGNLISRGNRCRKVNVIGYQGFRSPNYPLLGEAGEFITIDSKNVRLKPETDLQVLNELDTRVIMLEVFPGMQHSPILENILSDNNLQGVILKAYGAGNIPTDPEFLGLFKTFIDKGGIVVVVTSVPVGETVMGLYETSQVLLDRGLIGGFDLTPEAAMTKLMMLLGNYGSDRATVKQLMQQSIAGEQRLSLKSTAFLEGGRVDVKGGLSMVKKELHSADDVERIERALLRFMNVHLTPGGSDLAILKISLEDGTSLGTYRKGRIPTNVLMENSAVGESLAIDLTAYREHFRLKTVSNGPIKAKQLIGFKVELEAAGDASFEWESAELNLYVKA